MNEPMAPEGERPLVSVILPAHNGATTIQGTLNSLARQEYRPVEWIVIDDGSTDGTVEIVDSLLPDRAFPARLIRHESNLGLSKTLNHGLREARGDLVLILHQDIELGGTDWISRGVDNLYRNPSVAVVTADYGIPALGEVDFVQKVFGILRRQFHAGPDSGKEPVTFTEFKCDLARSQSLRDVGGFPERFRIAGEDLWVSYSLRSRGDRLVKDYALKCVQRFWGDATSVRGNLRKEFTFGQAMAGTLVRFRSAPFRNLENTPYSRSRAWNRASQPLTLLVGFVLILGAILTRNWWFLYALAVMILGRLVYYGWRLLPDLRRMNPRANRALAEAVAGSGFGILSDFAYTFGVVAGFIRWTVGASV
ncbi:MAG: glycosyltransferase family 2 protein [Thermoplasmata archaeon]